MRNVILIAALLFAPHGIAADDPGTVVLDVPGMTCPVCPITVKKALEGQAGVESVKVDFADKSAAVAFDPGRVSVTQLIRALTDAGFSAALREK